MRVLIIGGNENQAVACVRSLSRAGHTVVVGESNSWSKAGWSRYCRGTFEYPAPEENAQGFVERIAQEARRESGTLVLPMTERTALPLSTHRDVIFSAGGRLLMPSRERVLQAFDKHYTTSLAASLGIAVPQSALIRENNQARDLAPSLRYPVVLKPRTSEQVSSRGQVRPTGPPRYARNPQEFLAAWEELRQRADEVLTQEFVPGIGAGYFALMREGELRAEFAHRRIRELRPSGSGSTVRVSVAPDAQQRDASLKILRALAWHGVAMVEFRVRPDGTPVFLEVNGRPWTSLALAVYAGLDFPALLVRMAEQGDVAPPPPYRLGVRCRWTLGDLRHLLAVWRGAPKGFPGKYPGRFRTLANFLLPVPGTYHDNFTMQDPLPELGDWLDFAFRKLPAELRKRRATREQPHVERRYSHP